MQESDRMNEAKKAVIWELWQQGQPMSVIGRTVHKPPATVFSYLRYHGGIKPRQRVPRPSSLTLEDREEISRGVAAGRSFRAIAEQLSRSPSTISRELKRNGGIDRYRATEAQANARRRARRRKVCLLTKHQRLYRLVRGKLLLDWSPEQISGWLERTYPDDKSLRVSHETIYKSLFIQTRGIFRKELRKHLRTKRKFRHAKPHSPGTPGQIVDGMSISERPAIIEDRAIPGHWEGDLIIGSNNSQIATLVERQTRYTVLVKVKSKKTDDVVSALSRQMNKLPVLLQQSLTWDRGTEMASHAKFTVATDIDVYFCDPQSPWQRGSNENTNGLLRQYFPKGSSMSGFSQRDLNKVAHRLNTRPRKTLDFQTPTDKLDELLQ